MKEEQHESPLHKLAKREFTDRIAEETLTHGYADAVKIFQEMSTDFIRALREEVSELKDVNKTLVSTVNELESKMSRLRQIITPRNYLNGLAE
jgi:hypothetical protein